MMQADDDEPTLLLEKHNKDGGEKILLNEEAVRPKLATNIGEKGWGRTCGTWTMVPAII